MQEIQATSNHRICPPNAAPDSFSSLAADARTTATRASFDSCPLPPGRCHPAGRWGCTQSTTCPTTTTARLRRLSGTLPLPLLRQRLAHRPMRSRRSLHPPCNRHLLRTRPCQPLLCFMASSSHSTPTSILRTPTSSLRTLTINHHTPTSRLPTATSSHSTRTSILRTPTSSLLTRTDRRPTEPSHQATRQRRSIIYRMAEGRPTPTEVTACRRTRNGPSPPRRTAAAPAPPPRGRRCFP